MNDINPKSKWDRVFGAIAGTLVGLISFAVVAVLTGGGPNGLRTAIPLGIVFGATAGALFPRPFMVLADIFSMFP